MKSHKVVIVEDEADIREVIEYNLRREGYRTSSVADGEQALQLIRDTLPDLVLLDLMLPGLDGLEVCQRLKSDSATRHIRIIMVTAKGEERDILMGLDLGADDYLSKPFSPKELLGRIRAVLRRGPLQEEQASAQRLVRGPMLIDSERHQVQLDRRPVVLTATEFRLLHFLATQAGRVFTRDQLLSRIIGENASVVDRNIDVHVRAVRKKLGKHRDLIHTVRGIGYCFPNPGGMIPISLSFS